MKCPACQSGLVEVDLGKLKVDICQKGCGGVWFDRFELDKTSSPHATSINNLLNNTKATELTITENKRLCPRDSTFMMQHFYSVKKQVKVDTSTGSICIKRHGASRGCGDPCCSLERPGASHGHDDTSSASCALRIMLRI